jgi:hypothetical protein
MVEEQLRKFPIMARIAGCYLAIPASSVLSELDMAVGSEPTARLQKLI